MTHSEPRSHTYITGQRLQIGGHRATVRYVGPVTGQLGNWVGLEWDDASRGKHNGSLTDRQYFRCLYSDCSGSFVRESKLQQSGVRGITVLQGIRARYQDQQTKATSSIHYQDPKGCDLVGERDVRTHQGQLQLLYKAALVGMPIADAGPPGELAEAVPNLGELDLTSTLVKDWPDALSIMAALPALRSFNLSQNRMAMPCCSELYQQQWEGRSQPQQHITSDQDATQGSNHQQTLQQARLNQQVDKLSLQSHNAQVGDNIARQPLEVGASQPCEQSRHQNKSNAARSGTCDLPARDGLPCQQAAVQLLTLVLNDCHVSWDQVMAIEAGLPALEEIRLCNNGISQLAVPMLTHPATANKPAHMRLLFPRLKVLDLAGNTLGSWEEVRHVSMLPSLTALNVSSNGLPDLERPLHTGRGFSALQALICGQNRLAAWSTVDYLAQLPSLQELRLSGNPLVEVNPSAARSGVIARMSRLRLLNGSVVAEEERRNCELHFLRTILATAGSDDHTLTALQAEYPALESLRVKYGDMEGLSAKPTGSGSRTEADGKPSLSSNMLKLRLVLLQGDGGGSGPDCFDERDGKSNNAASMGGRENTAGFLGRDDYDEAADYEDDVLRCTTDVSGRQLSSFQRTLPGCITLEGLRFLVARLLGVAPLKQHLLVVAPSAAHHAAPNSRHVRSLIDAADTSSLADLHIQDGSDVRVLVKNAPWEEGQLASDVAMLRGLLRPPRHTISVT